MIRRFLYFIPGVGGANPKMLADRGLLKRFTGNGGEFLEHCVASILEGPAGSGCIVCAGSNPPEYRPDQRWIEGPKFWVGIESQPPMPADLVRGVVVAGYETPLADDQVWQVPLIRRWIPDRLEHVSALPKAMMPTLVNGKYKYQYQVRPDFVEVDAMADRVCQAFIAEQALPIESVFQDAVDLLAVNYRIGMEEAGLLGLLDEATAVRILGLSIDEPAMQQMAMSWAMDGLQSSEPTIEDEVE